MSFRILSVAADDLVQAVDYYEQQSVGLGSEFLNEFDAAIQRICICPQAWTAVSAHQRRCMFRRFPFAVLYVVQLDEILVTAIMHLRKDPACQHHRVEKTE